MRIACLRLSLALGLVLLWASSASAFTGQRGNGCSDSAATCALADTDVDAGDFCILGVRGNSTTITVTGVSDDADGAWTQVSGARATGSPSTFDQFADFWYIIATTGAARTVTATLSGGATTNTIGSCFTGSPSSVIFPDKNSATNVAATSHSNGSVTGASGDVLVTFTSVGNGFSVTSGATNYSPLGALAGARAYGEFRVLSGNVTDTGTWSTNPTTEDTVGIQVVVRDAAAAGGASSRGNPRMGIIGQQ